MSVHDPLQFRGATGVGSYYNDFNFAINGDVLLSRQGIRCIAFNRHTGEELSLMQDRDMNVGSVWTCKPNFFLTTSAAKSVVWNMKTGSQMRIIEEPNKNRVSRYLHYKGDIIVVTSSRYARRIDYRSGNTKMVYQIGVWHEDPEGSDSGSGYDHDSIQDSAMTVVNGQTLLVLAGDDKVVHVWNVESGEKLFAFEHACGVESIYVRGDILLSKVDNQERCPWVHVWDLTTGAFRFFLEYEPINKNPKKEMTDKDKMRAANFDFASHDGTTAWCGKGAVMHSFNLENGKYLGNFTPYTGPKENVQDRPETDTIKAIAYIGEDRFVWYTDHRLGLSKKDGTLVWTKGFHEDHIPVLGDYDNFDDFLVHEDWIYVHMSDHSLPRCYNLTTGAVGVSFESSIGLSINCMQVKDHFLYTAGDNRKVIMYDLNTRKEAMRWVGHNGSIEHMKVNADCMSTVSTNADEIGVWELSGSPSGEYNMGTIRFMLKGYMANQVLYHLNNFFFSDSSAWHRFSNTGERIARFHFCDSTDDTGAVATPTLLITKAHHKLVAFNLNTNTRAWKMSVGHFRSTGSFKQESVSDLQLVNDQVLFATSYRIVFCDFNDKSCTRVREIILNEFHNRYGSVEFYVDPARDLIYANSERTWVAFTEYKLSTGEKVTDYLVTNPDFGSKSMEAWKVVGNLILGKGSNDSLLCFEHGDHGDPFAEFKDHVDTIKSFAYHNGYLYTGSTFIDKRSITQYRYAKVDAHCDFLEESTINRVQAYYGNMVNYIAAAIGLLVTFFQFSSFAFSPSVPWPEESQGVRRAFTFFQTFVIFDTGIGEWNTYWLRFAVAMSVIVLFVLFFTVQESIEDWKFLRPNLFSAKIIWIAANFIANLLAASAFLPVFTVMVSAFDCIEINSTPYILINTYNCSLEGNYSDCDCNDALGEVFKSDACAPYTGKTLQCYTAGHIVLMAFAGLGGLIYFLYSLRLFRAGGLDGIAYDWRRPWYYGDDTPEDDDPVHPLSKGKNSDTHGMLEIIVKMVLIFVTVMIAAEIAITVVEFVFGFFLIFLSVYFPPYFTTRAGSARGAVDFATLWIFAIAITAALSQAFSGIGTVITVLIFGFFLAAIVGYFIVRKCLSANVDRAVAAAYLERFGKEVRPDATSETDLDDERESDESSYCTEGMGRTACVPLGQPPLSKYTPPYKMKKNKDLDAKGQPKPPAKDDKFRLLSKDEMRHE